MIVTNEATRLELFAPGGRLVVRQAAGPDGMIEPDVLDRAVLGKQFLELSLLHFRIQPSAVLLARAGPTPLALGEVQGQLDTVLVARLAQLGQNVNAQRALGHLAIGGLRVPQAKAVVMFRQEQDIAHTRFLGSAAPLVGIATCRLEELDAFDAGRPFLAGKRAERPADEHAESQLL